MDDQIRQVGTTLAEDYYSFLDNCLEGTLDAFYLPGVITQLTQLDQDFEAFATLEYQFKVLEAQFNSGFGATPLIQQAPDKAEEIVEKAMSIFPNSLQKLGKTTMDKKVQPDLPKKEHKAHLGILKGPLSENLNDDNPSSTFFPNEAIQIDYTKQDKPPVNPLDNAVGKSLELPPTPDKEPLFHNIKKETQRPFGQTVQEKKSADNKPPGNLLAFAKHFAPEQQEEPNLEEQPSPKVEKEKQDLPQTKATPKAYNPPPKNLKSFADFIDKQQEAILPHPSSHELPATSHQPTATSYELRTNSQQPPANSYDPPPTAAAPKPIKLDQRDNTLADKEEITAFKADLVSNPAFVKQFLSTDNKPIPPELDYDELIDKLANHLYWEYKRYYGK